MVPAEINTWTCGHLWNEGDGEPSAVFLVLFCAIITSEFCFRGRCLTFYCAIPTHNPQVLVNNAGITRDTLAMRMKPDMWQQVGAC